MKELATTLPDAAQIRKTDDGQASVYDLLKAAGAKDQRKTFKRLTEQYPEVVANCHNIKFTRSDGRTNRETPVVDAAGWRRILTVLPGVLGKQYRSTINEMADQFFDDPEALNSRTLDRIEDPAALKRIELRARTKRTNKGVNSQIFSRGGSQRTAASVANLNNLAVTGKIASGLKIARGVKSTREGFTDLELSLMAVAEELEIAAFRNSEVFGHDEIISSAQGITADIANLRRKHTGALPHPSGGLLTVNV